MEVETANVVEQAVKVREALKGYHQSQDAAGLLAYVEAGPTPMIWSEGQFPFGFSSVNRWVQEVTIGNRLLKRARQGTGSKFSMWLESKADDLRKLEIWFLFIQMGSPSSFSNVVTPAATRRLFNRLPETERADLLDQPSFWSKEASDDAILRAAWETLPTADQTRLLPEMIHKAAIGGRLDAMAMWETECDRRGVPIADRNYTRAVRFAALNDEPATVTKLIEDHAGDLDLLSFLHEWIASEDEALVTSFLCDYIHGDDLANLYASLLAFNPGVPLPGVKAKIQANERQAALGNHVSSSGKIRSSHRRRS